MFDRVHGQEYIYIYTKKREIIDGDTNEQSSYKTFTVQIYRCIYRWTVREGEEREKKNRKKREEIERWWIHA
jgi:hypothetical protein